MIFLSQFETVSDTDYIVNYIHYMPLDEKNGLSQEVLNTGILVDSLPSPEIIENKVTKLHVNPNTKEVWFEYLDRPLTSEEKLQKIEEDQVLMQQALDDLILGGAI